MNDQVDTGLIATMEQMLLRSFPPLETDQRNGVTVGRAHGVTGRANSAIVLGEVDEISDTVTWAADWLRDRSCTPLFRLSPLAPVELVDALGGDPYNVTSCLHRDLRAPGPPLSSPPPSPSVEITAARPADWISERASDGQREVEALMNNVDGEVAWAVVREGNTPVSAGRGVLVDGWLCIQGMYTDPESRGRGFATTILGQLHAWALSNGATDAFLNVLVTNETAQSIYRAHGYEHVYDYRYVAI